MIYYFRIVVLCTWTNS